MQETHDGLATRARRALVDKAAHPVDVVFQAEQEQLVLVTEGVDQTARSDPGLTLERLVGRGGVTPGPEQLLGLPEHPVVAELTFSAHVLK